MSSIKRASINIISEYLGGFLSCTLKNLSDESIDKLCEIRLKENLPVILNFTDSSYFITHSGRMTQILSNNILRLNSSEIDKIFCSMCSYSVHSHAKSIANGYITLPDGSRVGIYGTAVTDGNKITAVRSIKGMNIRVKGDFKSCGKKIIEHCYNKTVPNVLICGPPACGKTTILKDLCVHLSDKLLKKISVIDERGEMSASYMGFNTDVLTEYPKADGIEIAVRTLSPDIIVIDEIGRKAEIESIIESMNSGVKFIATIHCNGKNELIKKSQFQILASVNAIDCCVFIGKGFDVADFWEVSENENNFSDDTCNLLHYDRAIHSVPI